MKEFKVVYRFASDDLHVTSWIDVGSLESVYQQIDQQLSRATFAVKVQGRTNKYCVIRSDAVAFVEVDEPGNLATRSSGSL